MTMTRRMLAAVVLGLAAAALAAGVGLRTLRNSGVQAGGGDALDAAARAQTQGPGKLLYHCPMHPSMVSDRPGECPICQMRMVPIAERTGDPVSRQGGTGAPAPAVTGLAPVQVSERKQQLIGVRTTVARRAPFVRTIRAVGRVSVDETRMHHVHTKVEGWVEKLYVNATGGKVRRGDPLLSIYSPELLATQEEYLLALRSRAPATGAPTEAQRSADELVESARRRLLLYDLTPEQIERLEKTGEASRTVTLAAPMSGTVLGRNVTHGERIDPSMNLLDIADLSKVWVMASVYEYELPFVRAGQSAAMTLSYLPGKTYRGRVDLVYPVLEGATRTAQVRIEVDNPELDLKPDMYASVELSADLGERLAVPDTAVLSSGTRDIVFVAEGEGYFAPREVRVGLRVPDSVEILDGVVEGESVVTSANFLVDSESKLKSALEAAAGAAPPAGGEPPRSPAPAPEHRH